jgi:hypothetical protein
VSEIRAKEKDQHQEKPDGEADGHAYFPKNFFFSA